MNQKRSTEQTANVFYNLLKELESFVDTSEIRLAFDKEGNAYLMGPNFSERLQSHQTWRQEQAEMRDIIAKYVPRVHPE